MKSKARSSSSPAAPAASARRWSSASTAKARAGLVVADLNEAGAQGRGRQRRRPGPALRRHPRGRGRRPRRARPRTRFGRIDLFCSNAGVSVRDADLDNAASTPRRGLGPGLGRQCHGPCLRRAGLPAGHDRARRGLFPQHRLGGRAAVADRQRHLLHHQARRGRLRREPGHHPQRTTASGSRSCARRRWTRRCWAAPAARRSVDGVLSPEDGGRERRRGPGGRDAS